MDIKLLRSKQLFTNTCATESTEFTDSSNYDNDNGIWEMFPPVAPFTNMV